VGRDPGARQGFVRSKEAAIAALGPRPSPGNSVAVDQIIVEFE